MTNFITNLPADVLTRNVAISPALFGIEIPPAMEHKVRPYAGFSLDNPFYAYIPKLNNDYLFEPTLRGAVLMWINFPQNQSLWIAGPTGCGKTSIVEQVAARLNWPVMKTTASQDLDINSLIGGLRLVCDELTGDTKTVFIHGPLALAYKYGLIFLLDEYDQLDPSCANAFNAILEGGNLVIPETNEVIKQHPNFRFIATANSIGQGDQTGVYGGIKIMNVANLDRYMFINADYMPSDVETKLVTKYIPDPQIAGKFVEVANMIRALFVGRDLTGDFSQNPSDKIPSLPVSADLRLSVTCSTRSLIAWIDRFVLMKKLNVPKAMLMSFDFQIGNRATVDDKRALHTIVESVFGKEALQ
ncbi:AAA family ATPase [Photorhabdus luminescens]|uniref:Cobalamin biosynthesis protein n=1 Tax=Photorhabdus luminescens subsp. mexicana TaxID=2100167 RepID=A0A4R4ITW9_PHOLU|nr:AAA family ATPase [Photorhabdus luminescens]TDB44270.1 cobalamin biosynthesis protein [Photorhabdus luminescens subsp. mexicana]